MRILDNRYRLEELLGRGGMGEVYRATHLVLERPCAVKLLKPKRRLEPHSLDRFRLEAEALARLEHPNIVRITDFGVERDTDTPFLVMELVAGRSLRQVLTDDGALDLARASRILDQIAGALEAAHVRGIVHGDVKPENVLVNESDGTPPEVTVLDFGLARFLSETDAIPIPKGRLTARDSAPEDDEDDRRTETLPEASRAGGGTPGYMAPELRSGGTPSPASDNFAFAVMAYELLIGHRPFGKQRARDPQQAEPPSVRRAGLPAAIDEPLCLALAAATGERPTTGSLAAQIAAVAADEASREWRRRERPRRLALIVAIAAVASFGGWIVDGSRLLDAVERRLTNLRFQFSQTRAPDARLVVVEIDDATLAANPAPLASRGDSIGRLLHTALDAGVAGVGFDILLPRQWAVAPGFVELVTSHPDQVVLAAQSAGDQIVGHEAVEGLITVALGARRSAQLLAFANVEPDPDHIIRRFRTGYRDGAGRVRSTFAARLASLAKPVAIDDRVRPIDFRVDSAACRRLGIEDLRDVLDRQPGSLTGRLLVLAQTFTGADDNDHLVPRPGRRPGGVRGVDIQMVICNTLLSERPLREEDTRCIVALAGILGGVTGWLIVWRRSRWPGMLVLGLGLAAVTVIAWGGFVWYDLWLPLAGSLATLLTVGAAAFVARIPMGRAPY